MKESFRDNYIPPPEEKIRKGNSHEGEPEFKFKFYYTGHTYEKDFEKLEEVFSKADIYIPEVPGWDEDTARAYNDISQGTLDPKVIQHSPTLFKELRIIYNSKKPIIFLDINGDFNSKYERKWDEFGNKALEAQRFFLSGRFDKAISITRECARGYAILTKKREDFVKRRIIEMLPKIVKQYPILESKLKTGMPLTTLLSFGSVHTRLYHKLKEHGVTVEREFSGDLPHIFNHWHELKRSYIFGKEPTDELVARGLLSLLLSVYMGKLSKSSEEENKIIRSLVSQLSLNKIKNLSAQVSARGKNFIDVLTQEGIKVPRSRQEFEELLKELG